MQDFYNECIASLANVPATDEYTMCPKGHVILKTDALTVGATDFCDEAEATQELDTFLDESEAQYERFEAQRDTADLV